MPQAFFHPQLLRSRGAVEAVALLRHGRTCSLSSSVPLTGAQAPAELQEAAAAMRAMCFKVAVSGCCFRPHPLLVLVGAQCRLG